MRLLYFVVNPANHIKQPDWSYHSHTSLAVATAEAIRLSKKHPGQEFIVMEARAIGKVVEGKLEEMVGN